MALPLLVSPEEPPGQSLVLAEVFLGVRAFGGSAESRDHFHATAKRPHGAEASREIIGRRGQKRAGGCGERGSRFPETSPERGFGVVAVDVGLWRADDWTW